MRNYLLDMDRFKDPFSKAAGTYDQHASIQAYAFKQLKEKVSALSFERPLSTFLDVGCGTGLFTSIFLEAHPSAYGIGLDISKDMIVWATQHHVSDRLTFVRQDVATYSPELRFDLVISNAVFQWMPSLNIELGHIKPWIHPKGALVFTLFTRDTYAELRQVLSIVMGKPAVLASSGFLSASDVSTVVSKHFSDISVHYEKIQHIFPSVKALLQSIKYTGTRGLGISSLQWTPGFLRDVERVYRQLFGQIQVTYGIVVASAHD